MAIVRNGVRLKKSSTPSSSSSDASKKLKSKRKFPTQHCDSDAEEPCQVGDSIFSLPSDLFHLPDLNKILSLDSWNYCLSEAERERLCSYLPDLDEESYRRTLKELFAGANFHFVNPVADLSHRLKGGLCHPKVVKYQEALKCLQRKEHYHHLRQYHNRMLGSFLQMQTLWSSYPNADTEERLQLWHSWAAKRLPADPSNAARERLLPAHTQSKGVSKVESPLKLRRDVDESNRNSQGQEPSTVNEPFHKGVLPMVPKGRSSRHLNSDSGAWHTVFVPETGVTLENELKKTVASFEEEESNLDAFPVESNMDRKIAGIDKLVAKSTVAGSNRTTGRESNKEAQRPKEEPGISLGSSPVAAKLSSKDKCRKRVNKENELTQENASGDGQADRELKKYRRKEKLKGSGTHEEGQATLAVVSEEDADWEKKGKNSETMEEVLTRDLANGKHLKRKGKRKLQEVDQIDGDFLDYVPSKISKKSTLPLVPPSAAGFPFSILHLLSAVRRALLVPLEDRVSESCNLNEAPLNIGMTNTEGNFIFTDGCSFQHDEESVQCNNLLGVKGLEEEKTGPPAVSFRELVQRVQAMPGDPRILEAQEPLQGLVRGVLKVFSCKTPQSGIKGWEPFVTYEKVVRGWTWVGPLPPISLACEVKEVHTSAEAWGIPQKMLYKIQDEFANWLKNAQETLQLLGQLALPPLPPIPVPLDEKERFRELRAQKSLITINPISDEMRAYVRREEAVRYSVPDMAFSYTSADGQKSAVAPLRRIGAKSNAKARDHFMLKPDRPSHVTILCLVRDAAARLPHSTGTRADVCALLRDSQYIVEDVSDTQLNQVVSGALDRLHYERDPCVRYDGDKKLWVYLHADRDEEDFEDNGTSSTKRWKRAKKDGADNFESPLTQEHGQSYRDDQATCATELDFSSPNCFGGMGDLSCVYPTSGSPELLYDHHSSSLTNTPMMVAGLSGQVREDSALPFIELPPSIQPPCANMQSHPMGWEVYRKRWDPEIQFQSHSHLAQEDYNTAPVVPVRTEIGLMIDNDFPRM